MANWRDNIVGERMAVDQKFSPRVASSQFSSQEWGLIMTAIEFEIADADDPEAARIVVDDSKLDHVLPELDNIRQQMGSMGGGGGGSSSGGGFVDSVKSALGLGGGGGGGVDEDERRAAVELTEEYAQELQSHLESKGRWDEIRAIAAAGSSDDEE